jgi:hypothetical protein
MATAGEQIQVSERVKHILDQQRAEGESYNDVLERILDHEAGGDFDDGFGRWSDDDADCVREQRNEAKEEPNARIRRRGSEAEDAIA